MKPQKKPRTVSNARNWVVLDHKKHGVGGAIRGLKVRSRKQDRRATSHEGYAVIFFPRIHGIGKACVIFQSLDRTLSNSPEAAVTKFMDGIAKGETWETYAKAGHRIRRVRVVDLGDA